MRKRGPDREVPCPDAADGIIDSPRSLMKLGPADRSAGKENPDDVDEVPVQRGDFDLRMSRMGNCAGEWTLNKRQTSPMPIDRCTACTTVKIQ